MSLFTRAPFRVDVVRDRSTLARIVEDGRVENVYRLQIMNAAERAQTYRIKVTGIEGIAVPSNAVVEVQAAEPHWVTVGAQIPFEAGQQVGPGAHVIHFEVERQATDASEASVKIQEKSTFIVPR